MDQRLQLESRPSLTRSLYTHVELSELEKIVRRRNREIPARRPSRSSQILRRGTADLSFLRFLGSGRDCIFARLSVLQMAHLMRYTTPVLLSTKSRAVSKTRCAMRRKPSTLPPPSGMAIFAQLASLPPSTNLLQPCVCVHLH